MLQWQMRVVEEKRQLDADIAKLRAFIESPAYGNVARPEAGLLRLQLVAMAEYSDVLEQRIQSWKPEVPGVHGGEAFQLAGGSLMGAGVETIARVDGDAAVERARIALMSGMGGGVLEANLNPNIPGGGNLIGPLEAPGS